ncbi:GrpB family protein [Psychrobacillus sp. L4]|uniref:GrpB family protein n=1 Tax=Psychrobacillus sp. L4 TaxID=3236892 RepID=UPI0036F38F1D
MNLGLSKNEVKLMPYTSEWNTEFIRVKDELLKHVDIKANCIEHIGSTAITDMVAKPIIDILVGVDDIEKVDIPFMKALQKVGFLRLKVERPGEIEFAKFTDDTFEVKTHFIHLVDYDNELWRNLVFFRDYLNTNEKAREEYKRLKITEYTNLKEPFVKSIFAKRTN